MKIPFQKRFCLYKFDLLSVRRYFFNSPTFRKAYQVRPPNFKFRKRLKSDIAFEVEKLYPIRFAFKKNVTLLNKMQEMSPNFFNRKKARKFLEAFFTILRRMLLLGNMVDLKPIAFSLKAIFFFNYHEEFERSRSMKVIGALTSKLNFLFKKESVKNNFNTWNNVLKQKLIKIDEYFDPLEEDNEDEFF